MEHGGGKQYDFGNGENDADGADEDNDNVGTSWQLDERSLE